MVVDAGGGGALLVVVEVRVALVVTQHVQVVIGPSASNHPVHGETYVHVLLGETDVYALCHGNSVCICIVQ